MWTCDYFGTIDYKWVVFVATMSYSENSHIFLGLKSYEFFTCTSVESCNTCVVVLLVIFFLTFLRAYLFL